MPDEIVVKTNANPTETPTDSAKESTSVTFNPSHLANLCALGLLCAFFMPWIRILGSDVSGFQLQKFGGMTKAFWLIPICSGITVIAGVTNNGQRFAAQMTGALPYFALIYGLNQTGSDLMKVLNFGGYASLALGLVLFVVGRRLK